ncbi:MAG TPA: histidine phosphatase family protein [Methylotenera sp.]|jgi:phosphohistidine phosphatase
MADIIFWRHAEAEDVSASGKDIDRALTKRGRKDAARMAKWLSQHLPAVTLVLCSPAQRCLETAAALSALNQVQIKIEDFLSVDSNVEHIAKELARKYSGKTVLIVGHQPNLGLLIVRLLGMHQSAGVVKKGSVWWVRQRTDGEAKSYYIYGVQQPGN